MQFTISREALLKPLQLVAGVVERRQTLPVLSNVLVSLREGQLSLTGTDLEVELVGRVVVDDEIQAGDITVPARKFLDIVKSLPDGVKIDFPTEWVHLRKSNTEPIIRIYTEAPTQTEADVLAERFVKELKEIAGI